MREQFSPLSLSPFILYDPSDLSTLFQNSGGTGSVAADGDPVGFWADLSGGAHTLTQATAGTRPTFKTSGGLNWLNVTTTQGMQSAAFGATVAQPFDIVAAIRVTGAPGGADNLAVGSSAPRCSLGTATNEVVGYAGGVADVRSTLNTNTLGVVTFRVDGANSTTKVDQGSFATPANVGSNGFGQSTVNLGASAGSQFDLFWWAAFPQLSAANLAAVITYAGAKQGRAI